MSEKYIFDNAKSDAFTDFVMINLSLMIPNLSL